MSIRLFVGNLSYDVTEADLREHFATAGPLSYVYLPTDRETGKKRGFAFVEYADPAHARDAILRFNNQPLKGRAISVSEAVARDQRPPAPRPRPPSAPSAGGSLAPPSAPTERSFGPDAAPRRARKQSKGPPKGDRAPKGPIRERRNARVVFGTDDDNIQDDELMGENFASREDHWQCDPESEES